MAQSPPAPRRRSFLASLTPRARRLLLAAAGGAVVLAAVLALVLATLAPQPSPAPTAPESAQAQPEPADPYRPVFHNTPPEAWMNDPQRPLLVDGVWQAYYLYNADHPHGNGTSWRRMSSTDLVHWKDEGVAIEKFQNGLGDIETGTAFVDEEGTAGFGRGAVVAILTQQHDGVQRQSLFGSADGGRTFRSDTANPIMENPGQHDWRDPRVVRDEARGQWVMALAEGPKIGFYASTDLRSWTYTSGFESPGLGTLECPDLFELTLDGDPQRPRWVLMAGANGAAESRTTGTAYWVGQWDGKQFVPDQAQPSHRWADDGPDFYAALAWADPRVADQRASRYLMGWMNNWAYARNVPTGAWMGADSAVRTVRLVTDDGGARLASEPVPALGDAEGAETTAEAQTLSPGSPGSPGPPGPAFEADQPGGGAFVLDTELTRGPGEDRIEARIQLLAGGEPYATVGYDFARGQAFVVRDDAFARGDSGVWDNAAEAAGAAAARTPKEASLEAYRALRTSPGEPGAETVRLRLYVDRSSVEVFVDGGRSTLTALTFPPAGERSLRVEAVGGAVRMGTFRMAAVK
ncbi:glycoside hydrolase family 32 protein [Sinomonas mesophila]|uniref:glycoside hydrolase family 32 protein n=1 Tax=Sinomonas mesophila TaxID=1531955 RepID=UPI0009848ED9|nr:glycoside hydrolase family 32 protein [Sinomonas mesophila]